MATSPNLDELIANAWPPAELIGQCGWRFRWTSGVTRRANSVLALGSDENMAELVAFGETFYDSRRSTPCFQVSTASAPPGLASHLLAKDYQARVRTLVLRAGVEEVIERTTPGSWPVRAAEIVTEGWFATYWPVESSAASTKEQERIYREILLVPRLAMRFVEIGEQRRTRSVGQVVFEQGWGGLQCIATVPSDRRRGLATATLHHLAAEASRAGIGALYLAVVAENVAARALYERSGFIFDHEYSYFTPA